MLGWIFTEHLKKNENHEFAPYIPESLADLSLCSCLVIN